MILFVILLITACIFLGFIILVQNPKGGGLAGNVAGFSNQFMGVKQTTDVLEKGTWVLATVVLVLCLFSTAFIPKVSNNQVRDYKVTPSSSSSPVNSNQQPLTPAPVSPGK
jgi:preprotein translocase subunit SecG